MLPCSIAAEPGIAELAFVFAARRIARLSSNLVSVGQAEWVRECVIG
jgi:hypothetical protein